MKRLIFILTAILLFSCSNDDDKGYELPPIVPEEVQADDFPHVGRNQSERIVFTKIGFGRKRELADIVECTNRICTQSQFFIQCSIERSVHGLCNGILESVQLKAVELIPRHGFDLRIEIYRRIVHLLMLYFELIYPCRRQQYVHLTCALLRPKYDAIYNFLN